MKKVLLVLCMMLLLVMVPSVLADNETDTEIEVDTKTETEVATIDTSVGAELRFLQLERAIAKSIIAAERAIEYIEENYEVDAEIIDAQIALVAELELLADKAASVDTSADKQDLAAEFVEIKQASKEIVKELREAIKEILDESDVAQLRAEIKAAIEADANLEDYKEQIKDARGEYNQQRAVRIATRLGLSDDVIADLEHGEVTPGELKRKLVARVKNATSEIKARVRNTLMHEKEARMNQTDAVRANVKARIETMAGNRAIDRVKDRIREVNVTKAVMERKSDFVKRVIKKDVVTTIRDRVSDMRADIKTAVEKRAVMKERMDDEQSAGVRDRVTDARAREVEEQQPTRRPTGRAVNPRVRTDINARAGATTGSDGIAVDGSTSVNTEVSS